MSSLSLSLLTDTQTIEASDLNDRAATIAAWINYGIAPVADFPSAGRFIQSRHLYAPEFYGSPAPRIEGTTSDTHYRRVGGEMVDRSLHHDDLYGATASNTVGWDYLKGMAATIKILADDTPVDIFASFHTFEAGGQGSGKESALCAEFALFVDGSRQAGTLSELYASVGSDLKQCRKDIGMFTSTTLDQGVHHIGVGVRVLKDTSSTPLWKHVFALDRSLVIEPHHK